MKEANDMRIKVPFQFNKKLNTDFAQIDLAHKKFAGILCVVLKYYSAHRKLLKCCCFYKF